MKEEIGVAKYSIIPIRKNPEEKAEMVSQVLFGELYKIIDYKQEWYKIRTIFDDYEGWIAKIMHTPISDDFLKFANENRIFVPGSMSIISQMGGDYPQYIPAGSSLQAYSETSKSFKIGQTTFRYYSSEQSGDRSFNSKDIVDVAYRFMNAPYLWGGRTLFGIDCSGFTQIVYKICGLKLLRDAYQQFSQGHFVKQFSQIESGDLAFFGKSITKITHVGILIDKQKIIHASGKVRIDNWDEIGIFNDEIQKYTHKLIGIKRMDNVV